jgi:hypothetical protein
MEADRVGSRPHRQRLIAQSVVGRHIQGLHQAIDREHPETGVGAKPGMVVVEQAFHPGENQLGAAAQQTIGREPFQRG